MMNVLGKAPLRISAQDEQYLGRLVKLIPAEVVALYLTFKEATAGWPGTWAWICLGLVILVRSLGTSGEGIPPQKLGVAVASVSFVIWVYATGGHLIEVNLPAGSIPVAMGVWTVVVPYFYKGSREAP
jgi:hypothetical protein